MEFSPTIGKIAEALSKAQSEIKGAKKDAENPFYESHYADLQAVWEVIREPLAKNNLTVIQGFAPDDNFVVLHTVLAHSSGEWFKSVSKNPMLKKDQQSIGSIKSYSRRYDLSAIVGVYQQDDDAEKTMDRKIIQSAPLDASPKVSQSANVSTRVVKVPQQVLVNPPRTQVPVVKPLTEQEILANE